ncbi:GxxExxY protein [Desulfoplanes sp. PS50]
MEVNALTGEVIGCAIEVHKTIGPGLLESVYEQCLCRELSLHRISFKRQVAYPVTYKGVKIDLGYRIDIIVENILLLELKSVSGIEGIHKQQLLTYLRVADKPIGLILNFNVECMRDGVCRVVNKLNKTGLDIFTDFTEQNPSEYEDIADEKFLSLHYCVRR